LQAVVSELNPEVIDAAMSTSAAPCCADSWPTSRLRSPRRRTRSVKRSGKPARSLRAATGSTTRLLSDVKLDELKAKLSRGQKAPA
jgi:hypothetical protein